MKTGISEIIKLLKKKYSGLVEQYKFSETTLFYNPDQKLKSGVYFVTFKEADGPNDKASKLDRDGIYRMSFNPGEFHYSKHFGKKPRRPSKGKTVDSDYDFTELDTLLPHPVYAWMGWVNILNPTPERLAQLREALDEAYKLVTQKYKNRITSRNP